MRIKETIASSYTDLTPEKNDISNIDHLPEITLVDSQKIADMTARRKVNIGMDNKRGYQEQIDLLEKVIFVTDASGFRRLDIQIEPHVNFNKHAFDRFGNVYVVKNYFFNTSFYLVKKVSSGNVSRYKIEENHCFTFNPSRINRVSNTSITHNVNDGVNPMYVVFRVSSNDVLPEYVLKISKSNEMNVEIKFNSQVSVRNEQKCRDLVNIKIILLPSKIKKQILEEINSERKKVQANKELIVKMQSIINQKNSIVWGRI